MLFQDNILNADNETIQLKKKKCIYNEVYVILLHQSAVYEHIKKKTMANGWKNEIIRNRIFSIPTIRHTHMCRYSFHPFHFLFKYEKNAFYNAHIVIIDCHQKDYNDIAKVLPPPPPPPSLFPTINA